ncbi:MAG: hypothetical protein KTR26_09190 [Flammeovirgaceae bacterium]|nr:hypothetical protein [Flammeovirgaceae bacterium]
MVILYYVICFVSLSIVIKFICYLIEPENGQNGPENNHFPNNAPIPSLPEGVIWYSESITKKESKSTIEDLVGEEGQTSII